MVASRVPPPREKRWEEEAAYFDAWAKTVSVTPIAPVTLARYGSDHLRRRFSKEFRLQLLGDLRGRRVLDVGCGDGANASLFAKLGARVVGVDISPVAIELARERARVNGVADSTDFICSPIETADFEAGTFDVVWGDGVLHHIVDDLDAVMARVASWARPQALVVFAEPTNLFQPLRTLRLMLPIPPDGTPGERPLAPADLARIEPYFDPMKVRHFGLLGRLDRVVLTHWNYEKSAAWRRAVAGAFALADEWALSLPGVQALAATAVLYGRPAKR